MSLSVCDVVFFNNKWKKIKFIDSANTERKKDCIVSHTQNTTELQSDIILTEIHPLLVRNKRQPLSRSTADFPVSIYTLRYSKIDSCLEVFMATELNKVSRQEIITSDVSETNSISIIRAMRSDCVLNCRCLCSHTWDSGMAIELVSETSDFISLLTRLSARESFVKIDSFHILPFAL
jgi:hypothetical protein